MADYFDDDESEVSSIGSRDASMSDSDSLLNVHDDVNDPEDPTGLAVYLARCAELSVVPVSALAKTLAITEIHLGHHGIGPRGALALSSALAVNRTITAIDLRDSGIGETGACAIVAALEGSTVIRTLDLSDNALAADGGAALGALLRATRSLESLVCAHCWLGDTGAAPLIAGLEVNQSLTAADLSRNDLTERRYVFSFFLFFFFSLFFLFFSFFFFFFLFSSFFHSHLSTISHFPSPLFFLDGYGLPAAPPLRSFSCQTKCLRGSS
jgi:hypothetical protein